MSKYTYVTINGEPVESNMAAAFERMAAAFKAHFGLDLLVTSAMRTDEEQLALYRSGRTKAKPGTSNHNESAPNGPRAMDLRDSGRDAGVKYIGTVRSNWLRKIAPNFGFVLEGAAFNPPEGWHYKFTGPNQSVPTAPPAQVPLVLTQTAEIVTGNKFGLADVRGLQKIANQYTTGTKTEIDNVWGDLSEAGFDRFLEVRYGDSRDKGLAAWLRKKYGYVGDNVYGPNMKAALARANEANFKAL